MLLYIERWLKAPVQWEDGTLVEFSLRNMKNRAYYYFASVRNAHGAESGPWQGSLARGLV